MKPYFSNHFKQQVKRLLKKFPHLKENLLKDLRKLDSNNEIHIGHSIYKVRIKSSDLKKGKSGGFRSYILVLKTKSLIIPLCIYAKNEKETLTESELKYHVDKTNEDLKKLP